MYQGTGKITSFYRGIVLNESPIQRYWRKTIKIIVISGYIEFVLEAWREDHCQSVWESEGTRASLRIGLEIPATSTFQLHKKLSGLVEASVISFQSCDD